MILKKYIKVSTHTNSKHQTFTIIYREKGEAFKCSIRHKIRDLFLLLLCRGSKLLWDNLWSLWIHLSVSTQVFIYVSFYAFRLFFSPFSVYTFYLNNSCGCEAVLTSMNIYALCFRWLISQLFFCECARLVLNTV